VPKQALTREDPIGSRAPEIVRRLSAAHPDAHVALHFSNALEMLVATVLSAQCTDEKVNEVTATLFPKYPRAEDYLRVPEDELKADIKPTGFYNQKAASIRAVLRRVRAREGSLDLSFLGRMPTEEALAWLLASPGVGEKTASIVLLFSFGRPVFPVDTHIRRILNRLGWIAGSGSPYRQANELLPKDALRMRDLHLLLIELGRSICRARRADCAICPLAERCDSSGRVRAGVS